MTRSKGYLLPLGTVLGHKRGDERIGEHSLTYYNCTSGAKRLRGDGLPRAGRRCVSEQRARKPGSAERGADAEMCDTVLHGNSIYHAVTAGINPQKSPAVPADVVPPDPQLRQRVVHREGLSQGTGASIADVVTTDIQLR